MKLLRFSFLLVLGCTGSDKTDDQDSSNPDTSTHETGTTDTGNDTDWSNLDAALAESFEAVHAPGAAFYTDHQELGAHLTLLGVQDLESEVPVDEDTAFRIGSVTKTYTACLVLLLEEQGLLSTEDTLATWIPEFEDAAEVTLGHLLQNTSGVPNWSTAWYNETYSSTWTEELLLQQIISNGISAAPGETYEYSNAGFVLAGIAAGRAAGSNYAEALRSHLLEPQGLDHTWLGGFESERATVARGYTYSSDWTDVTDNSDGTIDFASGGLVATSSDLQAFWTALHAGEVVSENSYARMVTEGNLADGTGTEYGFGIGIRNTDNAGLYYGVDGGVYGYQAMLFWFVERDELSVNALMNVSGDITVPIVTAIEQLL
jgi:CubicO group peptidase (beta-lactamase class C family)